MIKQEFTRSEIEFQAQAIDEMSNDLAAALSKWSQIINDDIRVKDKSAMLSTIMYASMANVIADYAIFSHEYDSDSVKKYFEGVPNVFRANLFTIYTKYLESMAKIKKETMN